ncbi:TonB C-terminal domain-containing protein [Trinickia fusca]|uniref:Secretin and TonB N terminus short domain protein n=1 Tax=Trinickia fusca TaxID=2419777 RepID=A0A494XY28_9BURK|nr:TonB C-terminal domain-containing protein [Trinickia fusca]RKP52483.1 secretin and TonB N terminus short domain protein [Trinickia fusca]
MTRSRASAGVLALIAGWLLLASIARDAQAQDAAVRDSRQVDSAAHFALPAQPLAQALRAFGHMADLVVLAPAPLLEGRMSAPVEGDYSARAALERMLVGTGLHAEFMAQDEAIIAAQPGVPAAPSNETDAAASAVSPIDGIGENNQQRAYAAMLQARLTEALCAQSAAVPGGYRLVAQLRIDDKGTVVAVNIVTSSGLASRDAAIVQTMRALKLEWAPPPGLPEPVTILLRPAGNGVHIRCSQSGERN